MTPILKDASDFRSWLALAQAGDRCCYAQDSIARMDGTGVLRPEIADEAWGAYDDGLVVLVQQRDGNGRLHYLAQRRATAFVPSRRRKSA